MDVVVAVPSVEAPKVLDADTGKMVHALKWCSHCREVRALRQFAIRRRSCDGRGSWCKVCQRAYVKRWNQENSELQKATCRAWHVRTNYGLTVEEYDAILADGCSVCRGRTGGMHLDHDHKTGKIRGPLCSNCNRALGYAADDPERLRRLAAYLESHQEATTWQR